MKFNVYLFSIVEMEKDRKGKFKIRKGKNKRNNENRKMTKIGLK